MKLLCMKCTRNTLAERKLHITRFNSLISLIYFEFLISFVLIQNPEHGLRVSAQRGLACIFQALARKTPLSGLSKPNLRDGLTYMHYAVG